MPCQHVSKKTDHQCKRFCENSEELYKRHHRHRYLQPPGYIRPENIFPICLSSKNVNGKECTDSQYHCDCNISGDICPTRKYWNQSHKVIYEDKEKGSQQVRCKLTIFRPHTALYNIIIHHHYKHFHESNETTRRCTALRMLTVPLRYAQDNDEQQYAIDKQC